MNIQRSYEPDRKAGPLYLVGTPIGNLQDMTYRAVATLKAVDWIAAEDTRQTRKLLSYYDISGRLVSYHQHNKHGSGQELIRFMLSGQSVALVSDAGMPAISDPGYELVCQAVEHHIAVIPIPGANAALSALIACGLPTERFLYCGFLPRGRKQLSEELARLQSVSATLIFYEAPHRLLKTLEQMLKIWGNRRVALARELTKKFEEIARGTLQEAISYLGEHPPLGEYCIVADGSHEPAESADSRSWWRSLNEEQHVRHYLDQGFDTKMAIKLVASDRQVPKREVYNRWTEAKNSLG